MRRSLASGLLRSAIALSSLALLATTTLTGCDSSAAGQRAQGGHALTVGLTYVPNIQFAPFYVAQSLHYYQDADLKVTLHHHSFTDSEFGALKAGQEDIVYAGGDEMLQARSQSVPVVDIATLYHQYPVTLMVRAKSPVVTAADLKGHTIGVPGPYGETYFAMLALLQNAGLSTSDVHVQNIGFTQEAALTGNKVDAVMGYVNNDAVQFAQAGTAVRTISPSGSTQQLPLVADGLGATQKVLDSRSADVKAFVAATLRGVQYCIDHPESAVRLSSSFVPGLDGKQQQTAALAVLKATVPLLTSAGGQQPGYNDPAQWSAMEQFMKAHGLLSAGSSSEAQAFSNGYLP